MIGDRRDEYIERVEVKQHSDQGKVQVFRTRVEAVEASKERRSDQASRYIDKLLDTEEVRV